MGRRGVGRTLPASREGRAGKAAGDRAGRPRRVETDDADTTAAAPLRPSCLERLRQRGVAVKRSLALRKFAMGIEALERFVAGEPLHRVHECVCGVLALESEPVDPRL